MTAGGVNHTRTREGGRRPGDGTLELSRRDVLAGAAGAGASLVATTRVGAVHPVPPEDDAEHAGPNRAANPTADDLESFLDEHLPAQLEEHDIAGATVALVAADGPTVAKGYGHADVEAERPVRAAETLFPLASVSKSVTGTAVMRAVEAGQVSLDADVNEYLDGFAIPDTYPDPVTLEHLGTHTAGFAPQHIGEYWFDPAELPPLAEAVADDPPVRVRPPGEIASYSNYGFALAGHVVATTAGTTFADYARRQVFDPLGMDRSTFRLPRPDDLGAATAAGYAHVDGAFSELDAHVSARRPAGGMAATATDMGRFMRLHLQGGRLGGTRFLPTATVEAMHAGRFVNHPAVDSVGFGVVERTRGGTTLVGTTGDGGPFQTAIGLLPEHGLGLFVAYNTRGADDARDELVDAFVDAFAPPREPEPIEPDGRPTRADDLVGSYRHTRVAERSVAKVIGAAATLRVEVADDGTLLTHPEVPGPTARWVEVEPLVFRRVDGHQRLAFREEDGEITYAFMVATSGLERVPFRERTLVHLGVTAAFLLAFLATLFGWTGAGLWRRYTGRPPSDGPRAARLLVGLTGVLLLSVLVGGIGLLLTSTASAILTGLPLWFRVVLGLPTLGALGAVITLVAAGLAWRDGYRGPGPRGRLARLHYALLAVASLAFAAVLAYWNLLWTPF